LMLCTPY